MDVKFSLAASADVQGKVYGPVEKKAPIHILRIGDVDSVPNVRITNADCPRNIHR